MSGHYLEQSLQLGENSVFRRVPAVHGACSQNHAGRRSQEAFGGRGEGGFGGEGRRERGGS